MPLTAAFPSRRLSIKNVGASDRYVYLPYRLHGVAESSRALTRSEANQDIGAKRTGYFSGDSYAVYAQLLSRGNALGYLSASDGRKLEELPDMLVTTEEYGALAKRYTEIAQEYYTQLPEDGRFDWAKQYFEDKDSLSEIFNTVRRLVLTDTKLYTFARTDARKQGFCQLLSSGKQERLLLALCGVHCNPVPRGRYSCALCGGLYGEV